jgi:hypothetical protein
MRRAGVVMSVVGLLGLALVALIAPGTQAAAASVLEIDAVLGGRNITGADSTDPIRIEPREPLPLSLTMRNAGDRVEEIRFVRLEGSALGLTFLTYDLGVRARIRPGEQVTFDAVLDFFDLENQATGYLGTSLRVYDPQRQLLGEQAFVVDVQGQATSTLGVFALAVAVLAAVSVVILVLNTLRRRLPANRFVRGAQFAVPGAAIGITLALGVSVLRIAFADAEAWVPVVAVPLLIGFLLGYLAPGPLSRSIREVREEEALQLVAKEAVARASGARDAVSSGQSTPGTRAGQPSSE